MTKDERRAKWVAEAAIAYEQHLTTAQRLELLGCFFDVAFLAGACEVANDTANHIAGHPSRILARPS